MKSKFKIKIPEICHENWDKMTPDAKGRFCLVCNKSVIDFTNKLSDEIQHFFKNNEGQKICGRLKTSQLDLVSIKIPSILYPNTNYHKTFLLALSLFMGNNLYSQTGMGTINPMPSAQLSATETNQTVEQPKACKSTDSIAKIIDNNPIIMGPIDYIYESFSLSKSKNKRIGFSSFSSQKQYEKTNSTEEKETDTQPYFPKGMRAFYTFFASEFNPENAPLEGNLISFTVEENGALTYIKPYSYLDKSVKKEITRILKKSPKWIPGKSNGINTSTRYFFKFSIYNEVNTVK